MNKDFQPGDTIKQLMGSRIRGPYVVLDPPRTRQGKLRLRGPRGGYMTTWWTPESQEVLRLTWQRTGNQ